MNRERQRHGCYYVYIVECTDGTYYTGSTSNLDVRIKLHSAGNGAKYLRGRGPIQLVYAKEYRYYKNALRAERYLKRQTRRFKEELIRIYACIGSLQDELWLPPKVWRPLDAKPKIGGTQVRFAGTPR